MEAHCIEYTRTEWEESASVSFQLPQMILQLPLYCMQLQANVDFAVGNERS